VRIAIEPSNCLGMGGCQACLLLPRHATLLHAPYRLPLSLLMPSLPSFAIAARRSSRQTTLKSRNQSWMEPAMITPAHFVAPPAFFSQMQQGAGAARRPPGARTGAGWGVGEAAAAVPVRSATLLAAGNGWGRG